MLFNARGYLGRISDRFLIGLLRASLAYRGILGAGAQHYANIVAGLDIGLCLHRMSPSLLSDIRAEVVERLLACLAATILTGKVGVCRGQDVEAGGVDNVGHHVPEALSSFNPCLDVHCSPLTFLVCHTDH